MKKKSFKIFRNVLIAVILIPLLYVIYVFTAYNRLEDNLPLERETIRAESIAAPKTTYRITSANIGFGAYSDDYSFFMDGGTESRAFSKDAVLKNVTGSANAVADMDADIMLFQEVDTNGTRSHHTDERELLLNQLIDAGNSDIDSVYIPNYNSPYLFYPILRPHGKNQSGMLTVSHMPITESLRRSLPIEDGFMKFVDLDRCYSKHRMDVKNGAELIVYNLHLSAYTSGTGIAEEQLRMLLADMMEEYNAGNYIVAGGDFNKDLLGDSSKVFDEEALDDNWAKPFQTELLPKEIRLIAPFNEENPVPSCRNANEPYNKDNFVLTVDGFLASDNVKVIQSDVIDTQFQWSDHNPVWMEFELQ